MGNGQSNKHYPKFISEMMWVTKDSEYWVWTDISNRRSKRWWLHLSWNDLKQLWRRMNHVLFRRKPSDHFSGKPCPDFHINQGVWWSHHLFRGRQSAVWSVFPARAFGWPLTWGKWEGVGTDPYRYKLIVTLRHQPKGSTSTKCLEFGTWSWTFRKDHDFIFKSKTPQKVLKKKPPLKDKIIFTRNDVVKMV